MACPGSVRLCAGLEDKSSVYAMEGTAAHQLAEWCLRNGKPASEFPRDEIIVEGESFEVTPEMVEAVEIFRERVMAEVAATGGSLEIEVRLTLQDRDEVFGTADAVVTSEAGISVFDLKYGRGVAVEASDNRQLLIYALMAWHRQRSAGRPCPQITVGIVQPRAYHGDGPIREATYEPADILDFALDVHDAVDRALEPEAPLNPGEAQCRWCRAAGTCPAYAEKALTVAQASLSELNDVQLPAPERLSPEQVGEVLARLPLFEQWAKQVREHAHATIEGGGSVPGWKLVPKRATRQWQDQDDALAYLVEVLGVEADTITSAPTLLSPAQVEKTLGKKKFRDDGVETFVVKRSSGTTLAPDSDPRPDSSPAAVLDDL